MKKWRGTHLEEAKERDRKFYWEHREEQKEIRNKRTKESNLRLKIQVLSHYGKGKLACIRCGFSDIRALSIDHIEGHGRQQRKTVSTGHTATFYGWLRRQDYPEGFQTLCMNCQFIKKHENNENSKGKT